MNDQYAKLEDIFTADNVGIINTLILRIKSRLICRNDQYSKLEDIFTADIVGMINTLS